MKRLVVTLALLAAALPSYAARQSVTQITGTQASIGALKTQVNTRLDAADDNFIELYGVDAAKADVSCFATASAFDACFDLSWVNPAFTSVHATGGNIAASNKQVTKAWQTGLSYTADVTSVIHGGKHWIAKTTHTAGSTTEPGVGANHTDAWTEVVGGSTDLSNYLSKTNTTAFTPDADYEPATKKYVDDAITAGGGYTDEMAQDAVGGMFTGNTETGIAITYDDATAKINAVVDFSGLSSVYQPLDADLTTWAGITPGTGIGTWLATPSGANLASALTTALPASKGGTGLTALGTGVATAMGNTVDAAGGFVTYDADLADLADGSLTGSKVSAASESAVGVVELATTAEVVTGTDTARAVTAAGVTAKMAAPGAIGGTTPGAGTFTTIGAGAGGFSVDADGDVTAKSMTVTRTTSPTAVRFYEGTGGGDNYIDLTLSGNLSGDSTVNLDTLITTSSFDDTPDNGSTTTAPTSNWAYDHAADTAIHNIAAGASPTVDAAGEMSVDTTSDQFIYYGGAKRVLTYKKQFDFAIKTPVDADDVLLFKAQTAITITDIHVIAQGGTSISVDIQECDSAGANCATVDAAITADTDGAEDDGTLSNGTIDAGDWVKLVLGAPSGTVNFLTGSIYYVETAD